MNTKNQTTVQWLQECLKQHLTHEQIMQFEGLFQQSINMEKEQIKEAHNTGFVDAYDWPKKRDAEEYYNIKYGN
jgi:predicted membrane-bound dolichyl-phosphate-mannose-protein mannosyltransferase